ncbi:MAG TPA: hypothetical protein VF297_05165 [Pyrinomonadaceae bacterium]
MRDTLSAEKWLMVLFVLALLANAAMSLFVAYETRQSNIILNERTERILRIERCACGR